MKQKLFSHSLYYDSVWWEGATALTSSTPNIPINPRTPGKIIAWKFANAPGYLFQWTDTLFFKTSVVSEVFFFLIFSQQPENLWSCWDKRPAILINLFHMQVFIEYDQVTSQFWKNKRDRRGFFCLTLWSTGSLWKLPCVRFSHLQPTSQSYQIISFYFS